MDTMSSSIDLLAAALAKAQGEISHAVKDSLNPHFKSHYADLASVWDACRAPLSKHGLSVVQMPIVNVPDPPMLMTILLHSSGQWLAAKQLLMPRDDSAQAHGSALTYARRYALAAFVGIAQADDDGNAASASPHRPIAAQEAPAAIKTKPAGKSQEQQVFEVKVKEALNELLEAAQEGRALGIEQIWAELGADNDAKQAVWRELKSYPDLFAVIKSVLEAKKNASTAATREEQREPGEDDDIGEDEGEGPAQDAIPASLKEKIAANAKGRRK